MLAFFQQTPHKLLFDTQPHHLENNLLNTLKDEIKSENQLAKLLCQVFSAKGQAYLQTIEVVLNKPNDQDVVVELLNTIGDYFKLTNMDAPTWRDMQSLCTYADEVYAKSLESEKILAIDSSLEPQLKALVCLSMVSETLIDPIFGMTDAIGSVMRKKIEPITKPISEYLKLLQS